MNLGAGAAGALLAAVGTALPESLIPIVALINGGGKEAQEIAIGSIIGAPFLLGSWPCCSVVLTTRADSWAGDEAELTPLRFDRTKEDPPSTFAIVGQLLSRVAGTHRSRRAGRPKRSCSEPVGGASG